MIWRWLWRLRVAVGVRLIALGATIINHDYSFQWKDDPRDPTDGEEVAEVVLWARWAA